MTFEKQSQKAKRVLGLELGIHRADTQAYASKRANDGKKASGYRKTGN
jgi:hypothetical protein